MLLIIEDLIELGKETYNSTEKALHNLLRGNKAMRIKIVRKCRNGNFEIKYFDQQLNCWLSGYESESNIRTGITEGVFVVDNGESTAPAASDNSILAQARANAASAK